MSAVWVLALGASLGYLAYKRQVISGRLEMAQKEWEADGATSSEPQPPGASRKDLDAAKKYIDDHRNMHFHERLSKEDREEVLLEQDAKAREVQEFDSAGGPAEVHGVFLESGLPF